MAPPLQPRHRVRVLALTLLLLVPVVAHADPFEPPASIPAAQDRYIRGKALFAAKQYADAASEFEAAFALDSSAKFLLFDLALARRMAGSCREAITAYESFLATHPPERYETTANIGLEKCRAALTNAPPPSEPAAPPPTPPQTPTTTTTPPPAPHEPPAAPPRVVVEPWYHDRIGNTLLGAAAATGAVSGILVWRQRVASDNTFGAPNLHTYKDNRDTAMTLQGFAVITAGLAVAAVAGGIIRYATRPDRTIIVTPTVGGAAAALEVHF